MAVREGNNREPATPGSAGDRTLWHVGPAPAPDPEAEPHPPAPTEIDPVPVRSERSPTPVAPQLEPGDQVPGTRYRIVRFIGDGGMGAVYEAQHLDLERRVALKILLPELSRSPAAAQLFRREARTASKVGSDHIVQLYDFGELPDGRLMFTMELLGGPTLGEEIRRSRTVPAGRTIGILRQLCKGLAAAHAAGVVHRDIKPDNIVLENAKGRIDTVKILDFGIAAIVSDDKSTAPLDAGTPHVLAPELISGIDFDGRADIYSLGCTAYHMLTGQPPFTATGANAVDEILDAHLLSRPRPLRLVRPDLDIPSALERVVLECLEKAPADRYQDMDQLEAALCEAQIEDRLHTTWDDLPLPDVEPELRDRLLREMPDPAGELRPRRSRWLWPLLTAAAMAGGVGATYLWVKSGATADEAGTPAIDALIADARAAAAKTYYVYPPADDPTAPTAYMKIRELEAHGGPHGEKARSQARTLRHEFAATLVRLGDDYWAREGGKPFAVDYYRQALVFDREHPLASQRASLTPEALAELERKASEQDFSQEEIDAAEPLMALAESDAASRRRRIDSIRRRRGDGANERLDTLLAKAVEADDAVGTEGVDRGATAEAPEAAAPEAEETTRAAQEIADSGSRLLRDGKKDEARLFFERALTFDSNNATALSGMVELASARSAYAEALRWAERLVAASPGRPRHHLQLGDIRFELEKYEAARTAYTRARNLGSAEATRRLAKIEAEIGPPPPPPPPDDALPDDDAEEEPAATDPAAHAGDEGRIETAGPPPAAESDAPEPEPEPGPSAEDD